MRAFRTSLALLLLAGALAGCGFGRPVSRSGREPVRVLTTFFPITAFTSAVAGDCVTVEPLLPPNVGPHEFQASPADLTRLREAAVLVRNGLGLESFLDRMIASAENADLRIIDASDGVTTLATPDGHDHDHAHDHGPVNPHVWLDPRRAIRQVETIREGLSSAVPSCSETFSANAAALSGRLRRLDAELARQLAPYAGRSFVVFHDFVPYFADRYGLKAEFLVEVPEQNPTPDDLRRVSDQVRASSLRTLLSEPQEGSRSFNALAADLGVKLSLFDPMETGPAVTPPPQVPSTWLAEQYEATMRSNVRRLVAAFGR